MDPVTSLIAEIISGGADIATITIAILLLRMERRLYRLELRVFGFHIGRVTQPQYHGGIRDEKAP